MRTMRRLILTALVLGTSLTVACKDEQKQVEPAQQPETPAVEQGEKVEEAPAVEAPATADSDKGGSVEEAAEGGKWVKSNPYQVKFRVPEDWEVTIEDDGLSATDSDETTTVVLIGSESQGTVQAAVADVQKKVKIKDAKLQDSADTVLNGFPAQSVTGTAVLTKGEGEAVMDQEIQFIAYNVRVPKGVVTMMIFSDATMYEAKKETIDGLAKTLTKTNP